MDRNARANSLREIQVFWSASSGDFESPPDWNLTETYFVEASDLGKFVELYLEFYKAPSPIDRPSAKDMRSIVAVLCKPLLPSLFAEVNVEKYDEPHRTETRLRAMTWVGAGMEWVLWENPLWEDRLDVDQLKLAMDGKPRYKGEGWADLSYWEAF